MPRPGRPTTERAKNFKGTAYCATPLPGIGARRSGRTTGAPRQAVPQANVGAHGQAPRQ